MGAAQGIGAVAEYPALLAVVEDGDATLKWAILEDLGEVELGGEGVGEEEENDDQAHGMNNWVFKVQRVNVIVRVGLCGFGNRKGATLP